MLRLVRSEDVDADASARASSSHYDDDDADDPTRLGSHLKCFLVAQRRTDRYALGTGPRIPMQMGTSSPVERRCRGKQEMDFGEVVIDIDLMLGMLRDRWRNRWLIVRLR